MGRWTTPLLGALLGLGPAGGAAEEGASSLGARVDTLITRLADESYQKREEAQAAFRELSPEALPLVEAALRRQDLEPEARARLAVAQEALRYKTRRAEKERKRQAVQDWLQKTTVEDYARVGRRNAAWDEAATEALTRICRVWSLDPRAAVDEGALALAAAEKAIAVGCDDPLVLYVRARTFDPAFKKNFKKLARFHREAARQMETSDYSPIRKVYCLARAAWFVGRLEEPLSPENRQEAKRLFDAALGVLEPAARDPEVPREHLTELGEILIEAHLSLDKDRKNGIDPVCAALSQAMPASPVPLTVKGVAYIGYAWDARGSGWANTVTEEGWAKMRERLAVAEELLEKAWKLDPKDPAPPTRMLVVELGQGRGRERMELWFKRAMEADPDNYSACAKKLYYLEPKWHGSAEDMLAFGRECLQSGNWDARLPFFLVDAHLKLSDYRQNQRQDYFKQGNVWSDIQSVYQPYLTFFPNSTYDRSMYAKFACWCGQWGEGQRQFSALGDKAVVAAFENRGELEKLRKEAAAHGVPAKPADR